MKGKYPRFRDFQKRTVYVVSVNEGAGTEDDPIRAVHLYFDEDCKPLFRVDLWRKNESPI
jgi:hypothetical protein